jgi:hypothetical protein
MIAFFAGLFLGGIIGMIFLSLCMIAKSSERLHGRIVPVQDRGNPVAKRPGGHSDPDQRREWNRLNGTEMPADLQP